MATTKTKLKLAPIEGLSSDDESIYEEEIQEQYEEVEVDHLAEMLDIPENSNINLIVGTTLSGKTNLLINMLKHETNYKYDNILLFCGSAQQDYYQGFPRSSIVDCSLESLQEEIEKQDKIYKKNKHTCLFILDDCIGLIPTSGQGGGNATINRLATAGRHSGITTLVLTQKLMQCNNIIRENCRIIWCTLIKDIEELSSLQIGMDKRQFIAAMKKSFVDKYKIKRIDCTNYVRELITFSVPPINSRVKFIL